MYVALLGYSQLSYVQAVGPQGKEEFIAATENAVHFFGGVPRALFADNLTSAVFKADNYGVELDADFLIFANHYGNSVMPARSYRPRDKAHVERVVNLPTRTPSQVLLFIPIVKE